MQKKTYMQNWTDNNFWFFFFVKISVKLAGKQQQKIPEYVCFPSSKLHKLVLVFNENQKKKLKCSTDLFNQMFLDFIWNAEIDFMLSECVNIDDVNSYQLLLHETIALQKWYSLSMKTLKRTKCLVLFISKWPNKVQWIPIKTNNRI